MYIRYIFCLLALFGFVGSTAIVSRADNAELLKVWSKPGIFVRERAEAVNRAFTNGTPIPEIVKVLGTNYSRTFPLSAAYYPAGPEPRKTWSLLYQFGYDSVDIGTDASTNADPLTAKFTGAGYSWTRRRPD